jgi:hypothetical protein
VIRPTTTSDYFLQAQQDYKINTYRKYNSWLLNESEEFCINHVQVPVGPNTSTVLAHFKNTYDATVTNKLENLFTVNEGYFNFYDPWYIDDSSDPKGDRNRGSNPLPVNIDFSSEPNITTSSDHKGVFLGQDPSQTPTYYKVGMPEEQPITVNGQERKFFPYKWTGTGVSFQDEYASLTGVVFTSFLLLLA